MVLKGLPLGLLGDSWTVGERRLKITSVCIWCWHVTSIRPHQLNYLFIIPSLNFYFQSSKFMITTQQGV